MPKLRARAQRDAVGTLLAAAEASAARVADGGAGGASELCAVLEKELRRGEGVQLEATPLHVLVTHLRVAAPRVALEVRAQRHDVVEPERRDVERVARLQYHLEAPHL